MARPKLPADLPPDPADAYRLGYADGLRRQQLDAARGGKARAAKLTDERRREIARKAIQARWAKAKAAL